MPEVIRQNGASSIRVDSIVMDKRLMFREKIDEELVESYYERYKNGFYMPPIKVCEVKNVGRLLVDGFHRLTAAKKAHLEYIDTVIEYGSYDDAEWAAANANLTHGKALNRKERRRVAALYLRRYPERSDSWIAEDVGLSDKTVAEVRRELEEEGSIPELDQFKTKDGRTYPRTISKTSKKEPSEKKDIPETSQQKTREISKEVKEPQLPKEESGTKKLAGSLAEGLKEVLDKADYIETEWKDDGTKIVKDKAGNVLKTEKIQTAPKRTDYHKKDWSGMIKESELKKKSIDELVNSGCEHVSLEGIESKFRKCIVLAINAAYDELLWEDDEVYDEFEADGRRFEVIIREKGEKDDEDGQSIYFPEVDDLNDEFGISEEEIKQTEDLLDI